MRKFWITTVVYVTVVIGVIAGAAAAFNALVGMPAKGASNQVVTQMGPIQRTSGKWTPVEIKREPPTSIAPPPFLMSLRAWLRLPMLPPR